MDNEEYQYFKTNRMSRILYIYHSEYKTKDDKRDLCRMIAKKYFGIKLSFNE